jgi:spore coat protein U-like protein
VIIGRACPRLRRIAMLVLLLPGHALALNCTVTVTPLAFGVYTPGQSGPLDAVADISVRCVAQPGTYAVSIGPGLSGDQLNRSMTAPGGYVLDYNLYRDAARTQVWGNGIAPTFVVTGNRPSVGRPTVNVHPLYGRIFASQTPDPGSYTDSLVVTVLF